MKKLVLAGLIATTFIACKKSDTSNFIEKLNAKDSLLTEAKEDINSIDSQVATVTDSLSLPQLVKEKEKIGQVFDDHKKALDSLTTKINGFKNEIDKEKINRSIDSVKALVKKTSINKGKESITKIIYKEKKPTEQPKPTEPNLIKTGQIELNVDHLAIAKDQIKNELEKFDSSIKTENLLSNEEGKTYYIKAKVPLQKFDYLVEALTQNIGKVKLKNLEINGSNYNHNNLCNLEITLYQNPGATVTKKNGNFGQQSWSAIAAGGGAVGSIILFLLPLWPFFLIAGIGFYFYKKKQKQDTPIQK